MTSAQQPRGDDSRPLAMPGMPSESLSVSAAAERAEAAIAAAREILAVPQLVETVGQFATLLSAMPAEMPVVVNEVTRIAPDAIGQRTVVATAIRLSMTASRPELPVRDGDGTEYDVVEPAVELSTCVLADTDAPLPALDDLDEWPMLDRRDRIDTALRAGHLGEYLVLTGQSLRAVADTLELTVRDRCPDTRALFELAGAAMRLRSLATTLIRNAGSADKPTED